VTTASPVSATVQPTIVDEICPSATSHPHRSEPLATAIALDNRGVTG
jgi:hypothetical protein